MKGRETSSDWIRFHVQKEKDITGEDSFSAIGSWWTPEFVTSGSVHAPRDRAHFDYQDVG